MTGVYNPKTFIPHAALLHQAFAHCERFETAATRRCLDRVSVPVWLIILSDQLPVLALVSHYLTNKLIGRKALLIRQARRSPALVSQSWDWEPHAVLILLSKGYPPYKGRFFTCYAPVRHFHVQIASYLNDLVRLACLNHAASVHSEPGSNSPKNREFRNPWILELRWQTSYCLSDT